LDPNFRLTMAALVIGDERLTPQLAKLSHCFSLSLDVKDNVQANCATWPD